MTRTTSETVILENVQPDEPSEAAAILSMIRFNYPMNELTEWQWYVLECVADRRKGVPLNGIVTYRLCQRVEQCLVNGVFLLVSRYLQICPFRRQIIPKKTVRVLSNLYPLEMYIKNYSSVLKIS